jgi:hypothetical protein
MFYKFGVSWIWIICRFLFLYAQVFSVSDIILYRFSLSKDQCLQCDLLWKETKQKPIWEELGTSQLTREGGAWWSGLHRGQGPWVRIVPCDSASIPVVTVGLFFSLLQSTLSQADAVLEHMLEVIKVPFSYHLLCRISVASRTDSLLLFLSPGF